jgi:SAM-dependent methyltransferase
MRTIEQMSETSLAPVRDIFQAMLTEQIDGHCLADVVGGGDPERVAREVVGAIHKFAHLNAHDSILDIGCGCGRIATALTQYINRNGRYLGVDIVPGLIGFANKFITPRYPNFKFVLLNEGNTTYDWWRRSNSEQGIATRGYPRPKRNRPRTLCVGIDPSRLRQGVRDTNDDPTCLEESGPCFRHALFTGRSRSQWNRTEDSPFTFHRNNSLRKTLLRKKR